MSDIERMTIAFPEPMAATIRAAVATGEYSSAGEVVRAAVRLWTGQQRLREDEIEALRCIWDEGKRSGIDGLLDMAALIREAKDDRAAIVRNGG